MVKSKQSLSAFLSPQIHMWICLKKKFRYFCFLCSIRKSGGLWTIGMCVLKKKKIKKYSWLKVLLSVGLPHPEVSWPLLPFRMWRIHILWSIRRGRRWFWWLAHCRKQRTACAGQPRWSCSRSRPRTRGWAPESRTWCWTLHHPNLQIEKER